jgi:hypothetical protein
MAKKEIKEYQEGLEEEQEPEGVITIEEISKDNQVTE